MPRDIHDHWFHLAKSEGYVSRAAFKLIEIDDRRRILRHGDRVLDCGCAPGSWLQVASQRTGRRGRVVGIDLQAAGAPFRSRNVPNVRWIVGDIMTIEPATLLELVDGRKFDVILSDMAPRTTGDATTDHHGSMRLVEAVLERCPELLADGGRLVVKVFEGPTYPDLLQAMRRQFERVKGFKPKASRSESREMYVIAEGHRPRAVPPAPPAEKHDIAPPPPKPPPGWSSR